MDFISTPVNLQSLALRLGLAALLGAAVGVNREISLKPAGLRTHALVSLGAALATLVGLMLASQAGDTSAASRIVQGIMAGIGFIGGGVILHRRDARGVHGLTTASSIWIVSVTGVAVGAGLWRAAVMAVTLALVILTGGRLIDRFLRRVRSDDPDLD